MSTTLLRVDQPTCSRIEPEIEPRCLEKMIGYSEALATLTMLMHFGRKEELSSESEPSLSFDELTKWTRRYFENWHPIFPSLHAPTVLKTMEKIGQKGVSAVSQVELLIIRSLVSISLADNRQVESTKADNVPVPAVLVFRSVRHVMQEIQSLLTEPTTIPLLQAAFCAQLALTSLLRLNAASRIGGIPLGIRDDDLDVCYPGEERHINATNEAPNDHRLRLICHLAKFARIRGLILELRNKSILHSHAGAVEATHVNGELSQWWNEVYDDVNPIEDADPESSQDPALAPYHRLLLFVLRHEAIISMNRPLLAVEKPNPDYKMALQTCIASSRSLLAALKKYMSTSPDTPLTWPSFTWITWMACLVLIFASWEGEFPIPTALRYARMGISILQNLALRGSSWPETCIEAIRSMESALSTDQSHSEHESSVGEMNPNGNAPQHSQLPPTGKVARGANGSQAQNIGLQAAAMNMTPTRSIVQNNETPSNHGLSPSMAIQQFEPSTGSALHSVDQEEQYASASFSLPNYENTMYMNSNDGFNLRGQMSAGLIFGNMANGSSGFSPGLGQDILPFSEPSSLFMGDQWSVADGPWMIHGNIL
ncbi:fungal-specific transcription factor domain-containing protein [Penicillium maclennaniae]|uniref:fungal-specific transcription factor domain-containing protein n=1 Tax=Penicillium maclennaniae TaxID=1343394 RepID=UPI0025401A64|nr:fungal-specific transcription factor domain-containing protein [Penicillium maclennaniae]KAJ5670716.1 fungal-specific transcription factor domain-containing protein [Penicillium maclennaniae]